MRKPYEGKPMLESELLTLNPFKLFDEWMTLARSTDALSYEEVNAVSLATSTPFVPF